MNMIDSQAIAKAVLREHAELDRQTSKLRQILSENFDWRKLESMLASLEQSVFRHFELEETGGYMNEILEIAPHCKGEVEKLLSEHRGMREDLRMARHRLIDSRDRENMRDFLGEWFALLDDHERRENLITLRVFNTDMGGGD